MHQIIHTIPVPEINGEISIDLDGQGLYGWTITHKNLANTASGRSNEGSVNRRSASLLATIADACIYALAQYEREDSFKTVRLNYKSNT